MALPNHVLDAGRWQPPTRTVRTRNGGTTIEKFSSVAHVRMVDTDGNVLRLPVANGPKLALNNPANDYGRKIVAEKIGGNPRSRKGTPGGWLPVGRCPQRDEVTAERLPRSLRGRAPCVVAADGQPISEDHPCACIDQVIAERQEANRKRDAENEARLKPMIQRAAEDAAAAAAQQNTATLAILERMAALVEKLGDNPAPRRKGKADE
jgi:hypothetical protein